MHVFSIYVRVAAAACFTNFAGDFAHSLAVVFARRENRANAKEEIEAQRAMFSKFGENIIAKTRLTLKTEYIVRDIAMLMSLVFTENYSQLYWDIAVKPKRYVFFHHPVLRGFLDTNPSYPKPFSPDFEPVHMVGVQASGLKAIKMTPRATVRA